MRHRPVRVPSTLTAAAIVLAGALWLVVEPGCRGRGTRRGGSPASEALRPREAVRASEIRERAISVLTQASEDADAALRANAIEGLALVPTRAEPLVARALTDPNEGVRSVAAMVVGRARLTTLSGALRPMLNDRSAYVRASAILGLARTVGGADPSPLAPMLLADPSPRVRSHAAFVLGEIGDPSALPMIREAARTPIPRASETENKLFQLQAAEAMVKLGDAGRLEAILAALFPASQEDLEVTALAAQILGGLGYASVTSDLNNLAGEIDARGRRMPPEVRLAAAGSLARLGRAGVGFIADEYRNSESPLIRAQAAYVLGVAGHAADLSKLEPMLDDRSGLVRVYAATAILRLTSER